MINFLEKLKLFFPNLKKKFTSYFKKLRIKKEHYRLSKIKPKPYHSHKSNIVLGRVASGNVVNLSKLIELTKESKTIEDYTTLSKTLDEFFLSKDDIHYREYFLEIEGKVNILKNPEATWKHIIAGYRDIKLTIIDLETSALLSPDNYFYIGQLERVISVLETFIQHVVNIETKQNYKNK